MTAPKANRFLRTREALFEEYLSSKVPEARSPLHPLYRYALFSGGKRVRPLLVISLGELLSASQERVLPWAAAVEMVHTASLVHDDLPLLDNDDLRRGKPTLHKAFSPGLALLAGDGLVSLGAEVLQEASYSTSLKLRLTQLLLRSWGDQGIAGGQSMELLPDSDPLDLFAMKTGALFAAALEGTALILGFTPKRVKLFASLGEELGLVFQLQDDLQDGGPSSFSNLSRLTRHACPTPLEEKVDRCRRMVHTLKVDAPPFNELMERILTRGKDEKAP